MHTLDTSLSAYYDRVKPTLANRQKVVFDMLRSKANWTNSELAQTLEWPINTLTPRVNELRKKGLVEESGKRVCKITGLTVHSWRVKTQITPVFRNPDVEVSVYAEPRQLQMI